MGHRQPHRLAHIGLGLLPSARGKGYGTDVGAVPCHDGFVVRGLHRLRIETLADNAAMLRSAERKRLRLRGRAAVLGLGDGRGAARAPRPGLEARNRAQGDMDAQKAPAWPNVLDPATKVYRDGEVFTGPVKVTAPFCVTIGFGTP
ncbi:GNAT family N-acetyltransferase [Streptomyces broussonetiae]|uniref:GNAT family N-acetyltransferase n=1 Tax=Streptomyces broussonetiae TaxID=2686304 RepID=A0ABV5EJF7_9ACTN